MKGMKGKLLKKLKSIKPIGYLKPGQVLQVITLDGLADNFPIKSNAKVQTQMVQMVPKDDETKKANQSSVKVQEPAIIDLSELMRDLEEDEIDYKENISPETEAADKDPVARTDTSGSSNPQEGNKSGVPECPEWVNANPKHNTPSSEIDVTTFRRPDLNSGSLFDPNLLAAFEQAVMEIKAQEEDRRSRLEEQNQEKIIEEEVPPLKSCRIEENRDPLLDFEDKCPPGGAESVILYTTGLRGIRKTFEDCSSIRFLLESFKVAFYERDVSMHSEFREELRRTLGGKPIPPKLFIKGRYIGGAEVVLGLHEQGKLRPLFDGVPIDRSKGPCQGCAGIRFVMCSNCDGSRKVVIDDFGVPENCPECNENGLIVCPICC